MREIKFRAWDKEFKEFSESALNHPIKYIELLTDYEWNQYTGLKDKNGREIYEGDIVEYEDEVNGVWAEYFGIPIIYSNKYAMFCFKDDEGNLLNIYRNLKVIGNIYEDKHLLEG